MTIALTRTIRLDSFIGPVEEKVTHASSALKPGMLVLRTATDTFNVHATSGGTGASLLLLEDVYQGDATTGGGSNVDVAYSASVPAFAEYVQPGALRAVRLKASENVAVGDFLISGGDGTFIKTTGTPAKTYCIAEEASNVGTQELIKARFI